jgi:hypothetical protein
MGSFTQCCSASALGINWGEPATLLFMRRKSEDWDVIGLPIQAKYYDYGQYEILPSEKKYADLTLTRLRETLSPHSGVDVSHITYEDIWHRIQQGEFQTKGHYWDRIQPTWYVDKVKEILSPLSTENIVVRYRQVECSVFVELGYSPSSDLLSEALRLINASEDWQALIIPDENRDQTILAVPKYRGEGKGISWSTWNWDKSCPLRLIAIRQDVWTYITRKKTSQAKLFKEHRAKYLREEAEDPRFGGRSYIRETLEYEFKGSSFDYEPIKYVTQALIKDDEDLYQRVCKYMSFRDSCQELNLSLHTPKYTPQFAHDNIAAIKKWHDKLSNLSDKISKKSDE